VDFVLAVVEDSGNEEARENEKDIDSGPAPTEDKGVTGTVVLKEHHDDSNCAQAVQSNVIRRLRHSRRCHFHGGTTITGRSSLKEDRSCEKRISHQKCLWPDEPSVIRSPSSSGDYQRVLSEGAFSSRFIKVLLRFQQSNEDA
jgi:hypothetical protein